MSSFQSIERIECAEKMPDVAELRGRHKPFILSGAINHWPAMKKWSFDYLADTCGDRVFTAEVGLPEDVPINHTLKNYQADVRLDEFLLQLKATKEGAASYISNKSVDRFPGLEHDLKFDDLVGERTEIELTRLWIGSGGTKSSLHFDYYENVLCQVTGSKRVYLVDPQYTSRLYQYSSNIDKSQLDVEKPDLERYPRFRGVPVYSDMLEQGDCLFIPNTWWHAVRSLSPSISVNCFFGTRLGEKELVPLMFAGGPRLIGAFIKDFVWSGVLGRQYKKRLYTAEPFGVWFYEQLRGSVSRRAKRLFRH